MRTSSSTARSPATPQTWERATSVIALADEDEPRAPGTRGHAWHHHHRGPRRVPRHRGVADAQGRLLPGGRGDRPRDDTRRHRGQRGEAEEPPPLHRPAPRQRGGGRRGGADAGLHLAHRPVGHPAHRRQLHHAGHQLRRGGEPAGQALPERELPARLPDRRDPWTSQPPARATAARTAGARSRRCAASRWGTSSSSARSSPQRSAWTISTRTARSNRRSWAATASA